MAFRQTPKTFHIFWMKEIHKAVKNKTDIYPEATSTEDWMEITNYLLINGYIPCSPMSKGMILLKDGQHDLYSQKWEYNSDVSKIFQQ